MAENAVETAPALSPARLEANRKNAMRSTGPRTLEGKQVVRWNSLKHGLLSREVVIRAGGGKESAAEFKRLLAQLYEELSPEGVLEGMLVEKIAVCYWRLRRSLRAETGEIRKRLDSAGWRALAERVGRADFQKRLYLDSIYRDKLKGTSYGIQYLLDVLEEAEKEVEETGSLSEDTEGMLLKHFVHDLDEGPNKPVPYWCVAFSIMAREGQQPDGSPVDAERHKEAMLNLLREEKKRLSELKGILEENEGLEDEATIASLALPPREAVDRLLRYETTIERQMYRAMSQLERLQRQRKGDPVPPPIQVEVSEDR